MSYVDHGDKIVVCSMTYSNDSTKDYLIEQLIKERKAIEIPFGEWLKYGFVKQGDLWTLPVRNKK